mgnify:CR=1 FL=1
MDRILLGLLGTLVPGMAAAPPGHLAEVAGHGHWVAGATIGVAILVGLWASLKGRGKAEAEADPEAA